MANTHLAYPDLVIDKFCGKDPNQLVESFIQLIKRKINFASGDAPGDAGELANYTFMKKALFSTFFWGPAAEWYDNNITNASTWENVRTNFNTRFSDERNNFPYQMEVKPCIRGDGEEIQNFLHLIEPSVDKGWSDDIEGVDPADHGAERTAQARQRRQRYIEYTIKGLRPRYLQQKAQEYLMEAPNATWNDFSTKIIEADVSFQDSSNFLNDEEQTTAKLATLGQEMKNLGSELQKRRLNAVEVIPRTVGPNQKGSQNATRFCNHCRTSGRTPSWCRKNLGKKNWDELKTNKLPRRKSRLLRTTRKNADPTMDQNNGLESKFSKKNEIRTTLTMDFGEKPLLLIRISLQDQTSHMGKTIRTKEHLMINAQISHSTEAMEIDLQMDFYNNQKRNWRNNGNFSRSPVTQTTNFSQSISNSEQRNDQPKNYVFRKSDNGFTTGFIPCEQEFPQNNNQTSSDVVRLTTTDDAINELSDLCPLHY